MRKKFSLRNTLSQVAIGLLAIILVLYRPADTWKKNKISISIGQQWSAEKDQPAIIIDGFATKPGTQPLTEKEFFVQVSQRGYQWIQGLIYVFLACICIAGVWLFIRLPYRVLHKIAIGKPFEEQNAKDLRRIGWGIISIGLFLVIMPLFVAQLLSSSVQTSLYYPFWNYLYDSRWWLGAGIIILLVARAFQQGYNLHKLDAKFI